MATRSTRRGRMGSTAFLTIAINGSLDLPQYFVQAAPALALPRRGRKPSCSPVPVSSPPSLQCCVVAVWRVNDFSKLVDTRRTMRSTSLAMTRTSISRDTASRDNGSTLRWRLTRWARSCGTSEPADTVYVFGFSSGRMCGRPPRRLAVLRAVRSSGIQRGQTRLWRQRFARDLRRTGPRLSRWAAARLVPGCGRLGTFFHDIAVAGRMVERGVRACSGA